MLKILQTAAIAKRLAIPVLAFAIILPRSATAATLSTLYSFTGLEDGGFPEAGLVMASTGAIYGTTSTGATGWGSVFELAPSNGGTTWTETTIYDFTGGADGGTPVADLAIGKGNILYGTTYNGGAHGYGTVFQLSPQTGGGWTQKVLYSFTGGADGANPAAGLAILSSNGVLYGTTYGGGNAGYGTAFEMTPSANGWSEKVLYSFQSGTDGANPVADLVIGTGGTLFGTTSQGGSITITNEPPSCTTTTPCVEPAWGTVFALTPKGGGAWTESVLYTFTGASDGGTPEAALLATKSNVLYGSTFWGGKTTACPVGDYPQGCGTIFELSLPTGSETWAETVLYAFTGHSPDGAHPYGRLGISASGELFGTTFAGGANVDDCMPDSYTGCGTIFYVKPPATPGGVWTKNNIIAFPGSPGGGMPNGLVLGTSGTMYGTTNVGGNTGGYGTVFEMTF